MLLNLGCGTPIRDIWGYGPCVEFYGYPCHTFLLHLEEEIFPCGVLWDSSLFEKFPNFENFRNVEKFLEKKSILIASKWPQINRF